MSKTVEEFADHFKHNLAIFLIGAISFVVALQWQDVIKSAIETYFPSGSGLAYKMIASVSITIIGVPMIYLLSKLKTREIQLVQVVEKK